ncbi:hemolysin secretion protein D [Skermanella stibiiresistens SB22]|uniref:Hemolysin secretion protein D n=1 Tax=Skermanella stibiiresistens SB22 TaxID=1385369 RepID=W9H710_9PROT|nr:efflux RND transporter periplasmic adaptor subunit [Skermanella stibiiresistens]EWY40561.1 hemolysin secretion protein D [Skermanella stibiiresistens SB22]
MTGNSTHRARSRAVWLAGAVVALAAGIGAYGYFNTTHPAAAQTAAPPPPPVTVSKPLRRELIEWDEFTGQFSAVDSVEIRARVSGYLESVHFQDGQLVQKGQLLFVIDPRPFEAAAASARAQLAQATARLDLANQQLARAASLRQRDVLSGSVYDERIQEARVATAGIEVAKSAVRTAELDLEFTRVMAPVSGRISRREVSVGNLIAGGAGGTPTLLTTIVSLDPIRFDFDMSEGDFLAYQRATAKGLLLQQRDGGVKVQARLFDERDWPLEGHIDFIDNRVDRGAGTIRARAVFPNPNLMLTPGQFGRLRLPGSELYTATLLPDSAIVSDQSNKIVLTVAEDGTVVPKLVRPGPMENGLRIIRSGLDPDDRVIISGIVRARPGTKVTPQPGEIQAAEARP